MKSILLVIVALSLVVGGGYAYRNHLADEESHQQLLQHQRERLILQMKIDNDRLEVQNQELAVDMARRTGKKPELGKLDAARAILSADELNLYAMDHLDAMEATLQ